MTTEKFWTANVIQLIPPIPERVGHSIIQISSSDDSSTIAKCFILGGANEDITTKEVWEINLHATTNASTNKDEYSGKTSLLEIEFPPLYEFLAVPTTSNNDQSIFIFGGGTNEMVKNDLFHFDIGKKQINLIEVNDDSAKNCPCPRTQGSNKCLVEYNGSKHLAIFGGGIQGGVSVNDGNLYLFNLTTKIWSKVLIFGDTPQPRQGHVAIAVGSKVFIHGGMTGTSLFEDMFVIDLSLPIHSWVKIDADGLKPSARAAHNITSIGQDLFIFGGLESSGEAMNDLWKFNIDSHQWTEIHYTGHKIAPRLDFAFTSIKLPDSSDAFLIHGGVNPGGMFFEDLIMIKD